MSAFALEVLAFIASVTDEAHSHEHAARLLGKAAELRQSIAAPVPPKHQAAIDEAVDRVRTSLGVDAFNAAWADGHALMWEQAISLAQRGLT